MAPIRLPCPECTKKFYPEWFPKHPRPDAICYMCTNTKFFASLENKLANYKSDTECLKIENCQLKEEVIQLKEEVSRISKSMKNTSSINQEYQVVGKNKRKVSSVTRSPIPLTNRFAALSEEDQSERKIKVTSRDINKHFNVSDNEENTYVWSDSILRGQGVAFALNAKNKRRVVKVIPGSTVDIITADLKKSEIPKNSCLLVNVGTNDAYDGGKLTTRTIVTKFKNLISEMKKKTDKCILNGILPQLRADKCSKFRAIEINSALKHLCDDEDVLYNDTWNSFLNKPWLLKRDGIHLSHAGVNVMSRLLHTAVFKVYDRPRPKHSHGVRRDNLTRDNLTRDNLTSDRISTTMPHSNPQVDISPSLTLIVPDNATPPTLTPPPPSPSTNTATADSLTDSLTHSFVTPTTYRIMTRQRVSTSPLQGN